MPTYEYVCGKCAEHLEVHQSITEEPLKRHRGGCGGKLARVFGAPGIVLKGSGFYKTDSGSRARAGRSTDKSDQTAKADKAGTGAGTSDSGSSDTGTSDSGGGDSSGGSTNGSAEPSSDQKAAKAGSAS